MKWRIIAYRESKVHVIYRQLNQMSEHMQQKLTKQEKKWQKKVHQMTQHHASEIKKVFISLKRFLKFWTYLV